jgi:hypothetical protein
MITDNSPLKFGFVSYYLIDTEVITNPIRIKNNMFMNRWEKNHTHTHKKEEDIDVENKREGNEKEGFFSKESDNLSKHGQIYK